MRTRGHAEGGGLESEMGGEASSSCVGVRLFCGCLLSVPDWTQKRADPTISKTRPLSAQASSDTSK